MVEKNIIKLFAREQKTLVPLNEEYIIRFN